MFGTAADYYVMMTVDATKKNIQVSKKNLWPFQFKHIFEAHFSAILRLIFFYKIKWLEIPICGLGLYIDGSLSGPVLILG